MLWNSLMKKPVLIMGILLMAAFLMDEYRRKDGKSLFYREEFIAHSCKAVLVKLKKRTPANWNPYCEKNNLTVVMDYSTPSIEDKNFKKIGYRRLANDLSFIAKNSPEETLENVIIVRIKSEQPGLIINAVSEGRFVAKLATLNSPAHIQEHLKNTVQVKEQVK